MRGDGVIQRVELAGLANGVEGLRPWLPAFGSGHPATRDAVAAIIAGVVARGDDAVAEYTRRFDDSILPAAEWELPLAECHAALARIPAPLRAALEHAAARIRSYHEQQRDPGFMVEAPDGTLLGMRVTPVDAVGLYVPGGKAAYPSSVLMNAVPAVVAGVREIIAVTPPAGVNDAVLAALALSGVTRVFRLGGAHAVAALAYGTATVPRVDKIVGPGNKWVAEAKRQVFGQVGIDMVAGPTEVLILADETADPDRVALDLIAQSEHDEDAGAWLATTSPALAAAIPAALERALATAPRAEIARASLRTNGLVILVRNREDLADVANLRAAEHLEIVTRDPEVLATMVRHAGAIFLGEATPEPIGDYVAGPSHVLPTGGTARYASPLGVYDFLKRSSVVRYSAARLAEDGPHAVVLAKAEGLFGHAAAVQCRLEE
jgi:histidinol dehydrogenase